MAAEPVYAQAELAPDGVAGDPRQTGDRPGASSLASQPGARSIQPRTHERAGRRRAEGAEAGTPTPSLGAEAGIPTPSSASAGTDVSAAQLLDDVSLSGLTDVVSPAIDGKNTRTPARQVLQDGLTSPSKSVADDLFSTSLMDESPRLVDSDNHAQTITTDYPPIAPGAPGPLLPEVAGAPAPRRVAASQTPPAAESPNEVQVHIGRIEVTAVESANPPKRKARAARQPMSLDDYLSSRQRS